MLGILQQCCGWCFGSEGTQESGLAASGAGPSRAHARGLSIAGRGVSVRDGRHVTGSGTAMAGADLLQDRAYWEVKVVSRGTGGSVRLGIASATHSPDEPLALPAREPKKALTSWAHDVTGDVGEGAVVGCALDQSDFPVSLRLYRRGRLLATVDGVRGGVRPAVSLAGNGAEVEVNLYAVPPFDGPVPDGFHEVIVSKSLV